MSRFWILAAIAALLALSLVGCGSTATNAPAAVIVTNTPAAASQATPAAAGQATPAAAGQATPAAASQPTPTAASQAAPTTPAAQAAAAKLNLNTASSDELLAGVPGAGSRMVREFLEYRPYASILQFRQELGKYISAEQIAAYEQYLYVPIAVNTADAATLQQIPGLDAAEAAALIAARPYAANADFLAKLAGYVSETELAAASSYLSAP
jgi:DNA uptake protein ComE-like DNA-binding protein